MLQTGDSELYSSYHLSLICQAQASLGVIGKLGCYRQPRIMRAGV